jgi:hypothetical protein
VSRCQVVVADSSSNNITQYYQFSLLGQSLTWRVRMMHCSVNLVAGLDSTRSAQVNIIANMTFHIAN